MIILLKRALFLAATAFLLLGSTGCSKNEEPVLAPALPELPSFVSSTLVQEHLSASAPILLLDVRREADYDQGHLPSSMNLAFDLLLPKGKDQLGMRQRREISAVLTDAGVRADLATVVIAESSREGFTKAAATCWVLSLVGAEKCHVLEGGVESWGRAKGKMVRDRYAPRLTQTIQIPARPPNWVTLEELRGAMIETQAVMLDLRGNRIEDVIPGALRSRLLDAIGADGSLDREQLTRLVAESGVLVETRILLLGESVADGAAGWFLLRHGAGIEGASLFPGGFRLYRTHPQLPLKAAQKS